jgi:predicted acetyltransferase
MSVTYRSPAPDELDAVIAAAELPFGDVVQPADVAYVKEVIEVDRIVVAEDGGRIVGVGSAQSLDISVPGGTLPLCAVGMVSVLPTHRRRGVASTLVRELHAQARARGEAAAGLMASESRIYGRFGYGVATRWVMRELPTAHAALRRPIDLAERVRFVDADEGSRILLDCFAALRATVPGIPGRVEDVVRGRLTRDPEHWRDGAGARMLVAFEDRGVVVYRVRQDWTPTGPNHTLVVSDLAARDDEALVGLWGYLLGVDLVSTVQAWGRPPDEPLPHLLVDPRRLRDTVIDGLWLRPLDVPALLAARRYDRDGAWVLAVTDPDGWGAGTYRLAVADGQARVEAADLDPDVTLPVAALGAAYLGDARLTGLARAGRAAEHTPGALRALDRALAWEPLPWCPIEL